MERDCPPSAPPGPELRDILHQGLQVPMSIFHSGVSPPIDLDLAVARTDACIPLPGTLGDPPARLPGARWHTGTIAQ
eukprot:490249-Rhodomonas_salina.1